MLRDETLGYEQGALRSAFALHLSFFPSMHIVTVTRINGDYLNVGRSPQFS